MLFDNLAESAISIIENYNGQGFFVKLQYLQEWVHLSGRRKAHTEVGKIKEQWPPNGHPTKQEKTILQTEAESYNLQKKKETTSQ